MATPAIVQEIGPFSASDDDTQTLTGVVAGNTLVVLITYHGTASRDLSVSDDVDGAWSNFIEQQLVSTQQAACVGYYLDVTGGDTDITVDITASGNFYWMAFEVENAGAADAVGTDGINGEAEDSTNSFDVLDPAADFATDSIAFACTQQNTSGGNTIPSGWTDEGSGFNSKFASKIFAAGASSESVTFTGSSNRNWAGALLVLKDAGGGGGGSSVPIIIQQAMS